MPSHTDNSNALSINLAEPALLYRLRTSGKRQGIGKAVGLDKTARQVHVLDCTAGLGRDALVLAHLGCRVTMLERSTLVHAALQVAMGQAAGNPALADALQRMTLHHADAMDWFGRIENREVPTPDVIYLDPMFPGRSKSAKVKKEMALLQEMLGPDEDLPEVLAAALRIATYRVVVKRPPGNHMLPGPEPAFAISGKASHFAVYTNKSLSSMPL